MATVPGIFTGGTTAARDGVLVSDGSPIILPADGSVVIVHYRLYDDGAATGDESTNVIDVVLPTGALGSFTLGGSYVADPTAGATKLTHNNQPLFLKAAEGAVGGTFAITVIGDTVILLRTDGFLGTAVDTTKWDTTQAGAGAVTVSSGRATLNSPVSADAVLLWSKPTRAYNAVKTTKSKFRLGSETADGSVWLGLCLFDNPNTFAPGGVGDVIFSVATAGSTVGADINCPRLVIGAYNIGGIARTRILRGVPSGENPDQGRFWNGSAWSTGVTNFDITFDTDYVAIIETTGTQYRATVKSADESTTIVTTGWRNWSEVRAFNHPTAVRFVIGDHATNGASGSMSLDWFDEV